ncbi:MAG: helix-turn-helix domain-containing protein [Oscillospiraceae bacterium]|nr:helix-turn-helix domain-containing protein [Oscillospiraceae bacterium]
MPILGERFYQMSNAIFCYNLKPIPLAVYNYLVCCAGQKDLCWPSIKTIALHCNCSENAARDAVKQLVERGFIRKVATKQMRCNGSWRQSNNHYYILPLPALPTAGHRAPRSPAAGDGGEYINKMKNNKETPVSPL